MNPKSAIDAVLDSKTYTKSGLAVNELTLGRYALLELVNSPLVSKDKELNLANLVPTFYIMLQTNDKLKGYTSRNADKLEEAAFDWANAGELSNEEVSSLIEEIMAKLGIVNKV